LKIFLLDGQQRSESFHRSASVSCESPKEQIPAFKVENGQIMHLKPSQLSMMNQVNMIEFKGRIIIDSL
jgi:hypothetical protein